jgi:hypothetical protein
LHTINTFYIASFLDSGVFISTIINVLLFLFSGHCSFKIAADAMIQLADQQDNFPGKPH